MKKCYSISGLGRPEALGRSLAIAQSIRGPTSKIPMVLNQCPTLPLGSDNENRLSVSERELIT